MNKLNLFYKYYDLLYADKNYKSEVEKTLSIIEKYHSLSIVKMLEIGCGTANHTIELLKYNIALTAIDTDKKMIELAKKKVIASEDMSQITLLNLSIEELAEQEFDAIIALFNVITYIKSANELQSFFDNAFKRLNHNGIFVFDCWNGIAAIKDPPKDKIIFRTIDDFKLECHIHSRNDFFEQQVHLQYRLSVSKAGEIIESDVFEFTQTLWTPMQIKACIKNSGLQLISCCKNFDPETLATSGDWKIMFVCKKP